MTRMPATQVAGIFMMGCMRVAIGTRERCSASRSTGAAPVQLTATMAFFAVATLRAVLQRLQLRVTTRIMLSTLRGRAR